MYSGPGSGSMLAAAAAWNGLAGDLHATATSYESSITNLAGELWQGPASSRMTAAVTPYVAWMHTTAAQAAETAAQTHAAAAAYEAAFAATVPPPVIAANRTLLMQLIATNILGQNTPAIAATQAEYAQMWAQDAAAMYGYSASSAAATQLTPFTSPKQAGNPAGGADQGAAVAQAAGNSAAQHALSAAPQTLQQLALPLQAAPAQAVVDPGVEAATATSLSGLSVGSAYHTVIGSANFFQRVASQFAVLSKTQTEPTTTDIMDRVDRIALVTGAASEDELTPGPAAHGYDSWRNWLGLLKAGLTSSSQPAAAANVGQASLVGKLSVPQSWAAAAPETQLAVAETSTAGLEAAAPVAEGGGTGTIGAQAALAGMAGRALAGTMIPHRESPRSADRGRAKPSADAAREIAAALREYASLRDSGIITDTEFNKHKERLMSLDPLSGR